MVEDKNTWDPDGESFGESEEVVSESVRNKGRALFEVWLGDYVLLEVVIVVDCGGCAQIGKHGTQDEFLDFHFILLI